MIKKILLILSTFAIISCSGNDVKKANNAKYENQVKDIYRELVYETKETYIEKGIASYYGGKYNGRKTASGKIFNTKELTAAHKTLPFGTKVKVTNLNNNKWVIVTITDRGPFIKGRIIDLTEKAFSTLDSLNKGLIPVVITIIE